MPVDNGLGDDAHKLPPVNEKVIGPGKPSPKPAISNFSNYLPQGMSANTIASADMNGKKVAVGQLLTSYVATCAGGKLVDSSKKEVQFYILVGCWGNPTPGLPRNFSESGQGN